MDYDLEALLQEIEAAARPPASADPIVEPLFRPGGESVFYYNQFLEALRSGKHPPFCDLIWNGEVFYISQMIHFQRVPEAVKSPGPEGDAFRRDAWSRFRKIGPAEQKLVTIRVVIKHWLPVTAEVTTRPEMAGVVRLGTAQLLDFQNP